jgi:pyruvate/2-oxoglutarate/acetoin dehydrogenase E1 component
MVIRTPAGGGRCYGPTHSQSLEALFLHTPGIRIAAPATPADAKGLLKTAIRGNSPVLFVEHKLLYGRRGPVPAGERALVPFGRARRVTKGPDVTVVAWSWMAVEAEAAAADLAKAGVHAEVLDLRTLNPLDMDTIAESVRKTHRALLVEEGCRTGGAAAEIGQRIFETAYEYLDAPIRRVAGADTPVPASPLLERAAIPSRDRIVRAALDLVAGKG